MVTPLTPKESALLADSSYAARTATGPNALIAIAAAAGDARSLFDIEHCDAFMGRTGIAADTGFGFVAAGKGGRTGEVLISVRGTATLSDALTDLHAAATIGPTGYPVHHGFARTADSVLPAVKTALRNLRPSTVHVVGHSLGGAVALLVADVVATAGTPVKLYTFGAPRVGELLHTRHLCRTIGEDNIYRVYHDTDPVPMVPPFPYLHAPLGDQGYLLKGRGTIISGAAHKMMNYKTSVGEVGWRGLPVLRHSRFSFDTLDEQSAGLIQDALGAGPALLSAALLRMILMALRAILRAAGAAVTTSLLASFTVLDAIASAMVSLASASVRFGMYIATVVRAIMAFLGRRALDSANLTVAYLRYILNLLFDYISAAAVRAVALL